jgi:hypothetical protein
VTVVEVQGMNHFQFTDYVDPKTDAGLSRDKAPTLGNKEARAAAADYALAFAKQVFAKDKASTDPFGAKLDNRVRIQSRALRFAVDVPTTFGRVVARPFGPLGIDGRVDNSDIVATQSFQGKTYLLVRNSATGPEIWSLGGQDLTKVELPAGLAGSGRLSSLFGAMTAFRDKLFVAFSTGFQGASRAGSTGAELWSFDGKSWAPVVSRFGDADREVHVAACKPGPGKAVTLTLQETLSTPPTQGSLDDVETAAIDSAAIFEVLQGSGTSLVVQSNETAGDGAGDADGTTCASFAPGKAWNLRSGLDESGFGTPWNKAITSLVVYGDKLYASTGLNYDKGPSLFASSDGKTFAPVLDQTVFGTKGTAPISSSISAMTVSNVDGTDKLYIASNGIDGYGARLGTLDSTGTYMWLVDASVDGDSSGFDEAGLGRNTNQISSMVTFQGRLWLGTFDYNGAEILSLAKTSGANWDWRVDVGQDGPLPRGFGDTNQFATNLAVAQNQLWVGTVLYAKRAGDLIEGSGFGARTDGTTWQLASTHAYRLNAVAVSRYFEHEGKLMAVAARGSLTSRTAFGAAQLYTLTDVSNALPQGEKAP